MQASVFLYEITDREVRWKEVQAEAEVTVVWSMTLKLEKDITAKNTGQTLGDEMGKESDFSQDFLKE